MSALCKQYIQFHITVQFFLNLHTVRELYYPDLNTNATQSRLMPSLVAVAPQC